MKHLRHHLLSALAITAFLSCNEVADNTSLLNSNEIEELISSAQFDYKTKFQFFLEMHPFLNSPQWGKYALSVNNDSCLVINIPIKVEKENKRYEARLDIVRKNGIVNYYLNMRPLHHKDSIVYSKNDVLLCTFTTTEISVYKGYVENNIFKFNEKNKILLAFQRISTRKAGCDDAQCHIEGTNGREIDGGELPGVTITPDPDSGSGGSSGYFPPYIPNYPNYGEGVWDFGGGYDEDSYLGINTRFPKGNTLNKKESIALEEALETLTENCIYATIDNFATQKNYWKGYVSMTGKTGDASITSSGNLRFTSIDNINASALAHEWIHIYQQLYGTHNIYDSEYTGMAEFELALFQDIVAYVTNNSLSRPNGYFPETNSWVYNIYGGNAKNIQNDYVIWIQNICVNRKLPISINNSEFLEWSKIFGEYSRVYSSMGYTYGNSRYGTSIINSLLQRIKGKCLN